MNLVTVRELYKNRGRYLDQEVSIGGWVRSIRDSKSFGFIVVSDGSYFEPLQVVYHDTLSNFGEISKLNVGAAILVKGTLVATPQAKQPFEVQAAQVTVEGASAPDYPLQKKRHSMEYLRTITHLRARTNTFQAVFRVRSLIAYAIHQFFQERDFVYVHTPLITGSDCEGAGEMFQVTTLDLAAPPKNPDGSIDYSQDFFGKTTNLTVSGQLNVETGGKLQYHPPCGRILDDRAGDRICRPGRRHGLGRGHAQAYYPLCAGTCPGGDGFLQQFH